MNAITLFATLGLNEDLLQSGNLRVISPIDGATLAQVNTHTSAEIDLKITQACAAFNEWKTVPAPRRGELIRLFGNQLREHKQSLGTLVTLECGKILEEGLGEVQEMIDVCDFAVGLSRQLYGLVIASERPQHKMLETWHPLGPVGVLSAFNFPVAVWAWNAALAIVCGDAVIWKASEKTPLTALACQKLFDKACTEFGAAPPHLNQVVVGGVASAEQLIDEPRLPLISATGSTAMGRNAGPRVAARFGRTILELGGNNAIIVCPSADLRLAHAAILFGAVGTAGQRCTTTRRLFVHHDVYDTLIDQLKNSYLNLRIGDPMDSANLVGPLIDKTAFDRMQAKLQQVKDAGAIVTGGERLLTDRYPNAWYVRPALAQMPASINNVAEEIFAPILFVFKYNDLLKAFNAHNDVPQGLSSAIFTQDIREAEQFLSVSGSDCGIANVNIGTSGAEIGGAFGGEKATGGGRESGSDAWKAYMRRSTSTINYSDQLPLAQGIVFNP